MITPNASIPPDALCAVEGCGHRYDDHGYNGDYCDVCLHEEDGSFHHFARKPYVCGAATPSQEREAYDKAMRGEL